MVQFSKLKTWLVAYNLLYEELCQKPVGLNQRNGEFAKTLSHENLSHTFTSCFAVIDPGLLCRNLFLE